jgi:basic amino acid/polyamine antiporter, APA family
MEAGTAAGGNAPGGDAAPQEPTMFVRKASGLLKSWSARDAFIYSALAVNLVSLGMYFGLSNAPFVADGSILTAVLIAAVFVSFLVVVYAGLISTMPRAGGDYLWQTRTLGGAIAFVLAITGWCFILWHWAPIYADILRVQVASPILSVLGADGAIDWLSTETGIFVMCLGVIAFVGMLVAIGMEAYARWQKTAFWIALAGLLIMLGLMLFSSQGAFQDAVNREAVDSLGAPAGTDAYQQTIDEAAAAEYAYEGFGFGGSLNGAFLLIPFVLFFLLYPNWGATLYGEIRGAGSFRKVFTPMFAGLWVTVAATVIFLALADKTFGWDFYMASNAMYWDVGAGSGIAGTETGIFPFPGLLAAWLVDSPVIQLILLAMLSMWFFAWSGTLFLSSTRVIFAAAFDRILPEWAAALSERRRVPLGALAIMLIPSIPISALYAYSADFQTYTLAATLVIAITFFGSGIAAVILPWRRPEMWANSPASRIRIGPVPLVPVAGVIMTGFLGWTIYRWLTEDLYALNNSDSFIYLGSLYVLALVIYVIARVVRAKQGFNLGAVQNQIPSE